MKTSVLLFVYAVLYFHLQFSVSAQPYSGTIFNEPDIIISSDSSALKNILFTGQNNRFVFDRRVSDWITIKAYLFDVYWNDDLECEVQVNPEFGSVESARIEAEKYARLVGQLPFCLRLNIDAIWIHKGEKPFGGGNNSILIHTEQSDIYEQQGILEETLIHEASHTSLDEVHAMSKKWMDAQDLDGMYISTYAMKYPFREDIAESFVTWLAVRHRKKRINSMNYDKIIKTIPQRISYFDSLNLNLFPFIH